MAEHPNAQLVRRAYDAFQRGDLDGLRTDFTPDIKYHVPGRNQLSGDFEGADVVLDLFRRVFELTGGSYRVELHDVLATEEHAVALGRQFASRAGKSLEDIYCQVFHVETASSARLGSSSTTPIRETSSSAKANPAPGTRTGSLPPAYVRGDRQPIQSGQSTVSSSWTWAQWEGWRENAG